jgi:hypothetical protein
LFFTHVITRVVEKPLLMTFFFDKNLISVILKSKIMDQKEDANELITRIIKDGCQLLINLITKKKDVLH